MTEGSRPAPSRIANTIAVTVDLPLVPVTAMERCRATKWASSSERWMMGMFFARAAAKSGTCSSTAVETTSAAQSGPSPLPSWGSTAMPRRSSWARKPFALAAVERPVAAAGNASGHHLELGERTHAGAAKTGIVKAPSAIRVGDRPRFRRGDEHEIAFAHAGEELAHSLVRQPHAAMGDGAAEQSLVVGAVEIDIALERVAPFSPIDAVLDPVKRQDAGEDEVLVARLAAPRLAGRLARDEHRAVGGVRADPRLDAVPARRRPVRAFLAADPGPRGGHRPGGDSRSGFEPYGDLTLGVDHEQALGQRRRSAGARQACSRKIEGPGGGFLVGRSGHARTLP